LWEHVDDEARARALREMIRGGKFDGLLKKKAEKMGASEKAGKDEIINGAEEEEEEEGADEEEEEEEEESVEEEKKSKSMHEQP
jgi:ribosomal protein L12E/L44/L45/RPP1/RPP2